LRTVGIVCEYNPFHKGHLYMIAECRRQLGADTAVVCAQSGDFVQRGEAAIYDKFTRAEAACRSGADLVLELPLPWCLSSAEGFAAGALAMLKAAGCDTLAFGSESGDLEALKALAAFSLDPSAVAEIRERMDRDETLSFARARQQAARERLGDAAERLSEPNDILAVEYLKAIRRSGAGMQALAIARQGGGHDSMERGAFPSAMQLRAGIERGEDVSDYLPPEAAALFRRDDADGKRICREKLEIALLSRLYMLKAEDFERLPDAGGGAGRRLYNALRTDGSLEEIAAAAGTKRYTTARMRRMLLCAALGVGAEDAKGAPPYLRVLAANARGRALLNKTKEAAIPFLIKPASVRALGPEAVRLFTLCNYAHNLYGLAENAEGKMDEDWRRTPAIV